MNLKLPQEKLLATSKGNLGYVMTFCLPAFAKLVGIYPLAEVSSPLGLWRKDAKHSLRIQ